MIPVPTYNIVIEACTNCEMRSDINCQGHIDDDEVFCPVCGERNEASDIQLVADSDDNIAVDFGKFRDEYE